MTTPEVTASGERYRVALDAAVEAAREAGELLRAEFHREGGPRGSGGHADVDEQAERVIRQRILAALPAAYLGEETGEGDGSDGGGGDDEQHLWLVDPNDGTSAYLQGWRGSAVSIALLRRGVPVLGVVFAPCFPDDRGDLISWAEGCGGVHRNGGPVSVRLAEADLSGDDQVPALVFISQAADWKPEPNAECVAPARFLSMPSIAYRLALVAAGEGVAAVSLNGPGAWDYAGGHALLVGAGGNLIDQRGRTIEYDAGGRSHCEWCFGGAPRAIDELRRRDWRRVFQSGGRSAAVPLVRPERGVAIADAEQLARAQGCLLGQLAGDSLGGLVEFESARQIRAKYPDGVRQLADGGTWNILAGQPTDDSEMALMLARSIVDAGRYDPSAALDAYVYWYRSPPFDIGSTTSQALSRIGRDDTPEQRLDQARRQASTSSQSNGSLMRISPLGIFGAGRREEAVYWARDDSRLTHPHPVCRDACGVFVAAIAEAIGRRASARECYEAACEEARRSSAEPSVVAALEAAAEAPPEDYDTHQGWVLIALQSAFHQLLYAPSLEEGLVRTVMAGGDTDTNAAIAGALLGSVQGREAIPAQWQRAVLSCRPLPGRGARHPRPIEFWPVDALRLAEKLLWLGR